MLGLGRAVRLAEGLVVLVEQMGEEEEKHGWCRGPRSRQYRWFCGWGRHIKEWGRWRGG